MITYSIMKLFFLILLSISLNAQNLNMCSGGVDIPSYINLDINGTNYNVDLEKLLLPFNSNYFDTILCMSAINYFTKERGLEIIKDCYRTLKPNGVASFGVQDLKVICKSYLNGDSRFTNERINRWFGLGDGFISSGKTSKWVYDYKTLMELFMKAGFKYIKQVEFNPRIHNRPEQCFYLEAIK